MFKCGLAVYQSRSIHSFLRNFTVMSKMHVQVYTLISNKVFPFPHILISMYLLILLMLAIISRVRWNLKVLILISLKAENVNISLCVLYLFIFPLLRTLVLYPTF